jgi:L-arabinonolactonase
MWQHMTRIEVYSEQYDNTGEGPIWSTSEQALYWLDIGRKMLCRKSASDGQPAFWNLPDYPGCLAELTPGSLAMAMGAGVQRLNLQTCAIALMTPAPCLRPGTRFNDGKVDPAGRFWAGTMQNNFGPNGEASEIERSDGALYRFDADGSAHTIETEIGIANTLAWSPDRRKFYFGDSLAGAIWVYDFDADSGAVRNRTPFFHLPDVGVPDGSAMDVDGCLWNARWDGGAVVRITPDGRLDRVIEVPVPRPTSCAFGGRNLDILFVTSARSGLTPTHLKQCPLSGSVFAIHGLAQGISIPAMSWDAGDGHAV